MCITILLCFPYFPPLRNYTHPAQTKPHRKIAQYSQENGFVTIQNLNIQSVNTYSFTPWQNKYKMSLFYPEFKYQNESNSLIVDKTIWRPIMSR